MSPTGISFLRYRPTLVSSQARGVEGIDKTDQRRSAVEAILALLGSQMARKALYSDYSLGRWSLVGTWLFVGAVAVMFWIDVRSMNGSHRYWLDDVNLVNDPAGAPAPNVAIGSCWPTCRFGPYLI